MKRILVVLSLVASHAMAADFGDIPANLTMGAGQSVRRNAGNTLFEAYSAGTGTVTSFSSGNLSPLFTTSVTNSTTTPALSFTLSNAGAHTFFANNTGSSGAPSFTSFVAGTDYWDTTVFTGSSSIGLVPQATGVPTCLRFLDENGSWTCASGGSSGGAPDDAHYLTDRAESGLTNEVNLGALTTGLLKITVAGSVATPSSITDNSSNWDTAFTDRLKWDGGATGLTASTGRTSLGATTVGSNLFTLTNPSAITFLRVNADNTVDALNASDFRSAIGAGTGGGDVSSNTSTSVDGEVALFNGTSGKSIKRATGSGIATVTSGVLGTITNNSSNWDTGFSERRQWDGGSTNLVAATGRTSLGGTTVGQNFFTLTNPSAITWARINADNTITTRTASETRTDLSLVPGTDVQAFDTQLASLAALSYTGNSLKVVRVNAGETDFELATVSGGASVANPGSQLLGLTAINGSAATALRSDGAMALDQAIAPTWTGLHAWKYSDAGTNAVVNVLTVGHNSSGTPLANFGTGLRLQAEDSTTADTDLAAINGYWTSPTHGSQESAIDFKVNSTGSMTATMTWKGSGSSGIGSLDFASSSSGITWAGAGTSGKFMQGNGTRYVPSSYTLPTGMSGTAGKILQESGSNIVESTPTWPTSAATVGNVPTADGSNFVASFGGWTTALTLASDFTVTNAGLTDVTGMTFAVSANQAYHVEVQFACSANNTTGDIIADLVASAAAFTTTANFGKGTHYSATAVLTSRAATAFSSTTSAQASLVVNDGDTVIRNCEFVYDFTTSGSANVKLQIGVGTPSAGRTATIYANARMMVRRVR